MRCSCWPQHMPGGPHDEENEMITSCECQSTAHDPGCLFGVSTHIVITNPTETVVGRSPWECTRCKRVNAPHVDQCSCSDQAISNDPTPFSFDIGNDPDANQSGDDLSMPTTCSSVKLKPGQVLFTPTPYEVA